MDIHLPGINGIEALKILRKGSSTMHIPVIALSANAVPRDIEKALEAGFFNYLTKPIKVTQFMDALDLALQHSQSAHRPPGDEGSRMMIAESEILNASILIVDDQEANVSLLEQMLRDAGYTRVASTMNPHEVCALHRKNQLRPDPARPADARHGRLPGDGRAQDERRRRLPAGAGDHRPARPQAARAAGRREGLHQQALRPGRGQDAHPQHARSAAAVPQARELQQDAGRSGARADRRAARKRGALPQPDRAGFRLVLGAGRERQVHQGLRPGPGDARHPRRRACGRDGEPPRRTAGTKRSARSCTRRIAARQPFLDFVFSRVNADGSTAAASASAASRCSTSPAASSATAASASK